MRRLKHEFVNTKENLEVETKINKHEEVLNDDTFRKMISYVEYLADNLDKTVSYAEYLAENLDKALDEVDKFKKEKQQMMELLLSLSPELKNRETFKDLFYGNEIATPNTIG